jgi:hypothetical protein
MSIETTLPGRTRRAALVLVLAGALAVGIGLMKDGELSAQGDAGRACDVGTLRGDYGLIASGVRALPGGVVEKFVATGVWTFHGDGTFTNQSEGAALHGEIAGVEPPRDDLEGTYSVNSNCTGALQWQPPAPIPPIVYSFVIVDSAKGIRAAVMSPRPNIVTVELRRN